VVLNLFTVDIFFTILSFKNENELMFSLEYAKCCVGLSYVWIHNCVIET
jgi:hypothetical protein